MAEEGRPSGLPRGRRLPSSSRGDPTESTRLEAPRFDPGGVAPRDRGPGIGSLATDLLARGEVPDRVRVSRFVQAVISALVLMLILLLSVWLALRERPVAVVDVEEVVEAEVVVDLPLLGQEVRIRRPGPPPPPPGPANAIVILPEKHEFVRWRLDCPGRPDMMNEAVARDQKVVTIPRVPPQPCRAVFVSPGASQSVAITAGAKIRCAKRTQLICH